MKSKRLFSCEESLCLQKGVCGCGIPLQGELVTYFIDTCVSAEIQNYSAEIIQHT